MKLTDALCTFCQHVHTLSQVTYRGSRICYPCLSTLAADGHRQELRLTQETQQRLMARVIVRA